MTVRAKVLRKQSQRRELSVKGKIDGVKAGDIILIDGLVYVGGNTFYHELGDHTYIDAHVVELVDDIEANDVNMCSG